MQYDIQMEYSLFWAAYQGQSREIRKLLNFGVSVDAEKYNSYFHRMGGHKTPLQVAANRGHADCIQILLKRRANPNSADYVGFTALMMAAMKGHLCSLKVLLSAGAQCNATTKSTFIYHESHEKIPHSTTALHLAAANNHVECVKELLKLGADYSMQDGWGRTSLYICCQSAFADCASAHIDFSTNNDFLSLPDFRTNNSPLHFAVELQLVDCVRALVLRGADVNCTNSDGQSPLLLALSSAHECECSLNILRTILMEAHNLDISILDFSCSPAKDCVLSLDIVEGDIQRKCDVDERFKLRCFKVIKLLLACGANADVLFENSDTLLDYVLHDSCLEFDLLKRIVDVLPQARLCLYQPINIPGEFSVDPRQRKVFSRALLAYLQNLTRPSVATSQGESTEMYLKSDDLTIRNRLQIFWPPDGVISIPEAECYIAFHLSNKCRVSNLSYVDFLHEFHDLWKKFCIYQKRQWYNNLVTNPRSLKASCRYAIRRVLSGNMVRNIKKLPIPRYLQSFLLFSEDIQLISS